MEFTPVNAYRLQMGKSFGFQDARHLIPYLDDLGINTIYFSPYQQTVQGSLNPYEITSFDSMQKAVGSTQDYAKLCEAMKTHGMGQVIDLVVNHMARSPENPWFFDVLKRGRESPYAKYFDIDWEFGKEKLILPVLQEPLEEAIQKEKLMLKGECLSYEGIEYPLAPDSLLSSIKHLKQLIARQHYTFIPWQDAHKRVNFRRFFDIHELIALRMENPQVFKDFHRWPLYQVRVGNVQGFRIDHPDGLLCPEKYFRLLRKALREIGHEKLFICVEKILQYEEGLPKEWQVDGEVGYRCLNLLGELFIEKSHAAAYTKIYRSFTGSQTLPSELLYRQKVAYIEKFLVAEMQSITQKIASIVPFADKKELERSLTHILASFPRYRSYLLPKGNRDVYLWKKTIKVWTRRKEAGTSRKLQKFWYDFFVRRTNTNLFPIIQRIEQLTPAIFAKGFEDTHLYVYNRMTSLNEVGSRPAVFGTTVSRFHQYYKKWHEQWPLTMTAGSTHDTKRSEDVRMRIHALSEIPTEFLEHLLLWSKLNQGCPDKNMEYFFYQTLIGFWPLQTEECVSKKVWIQRLIQYMQKAACEAKVFTSWIERNPVYEEALQAFIIRTLEQEEESLFWQSFFPFHKKIAKLGFYNSLSAIVLRLGLGGVFDHYQGREIWNFALVDPDNRRPVDYTLCQKVAQQIKRERQTADRKAWLKEVWANIEDHRLKMFLLTEGWLLRKSYPHVFVEGTYIPIQVTGPLKKHVVAFLRTDGKNYALVFALRLYQGLSLDDFRWKKTYLRVAKGEKWCNWYSLQEIHQKKSKIALSQLIDPLPMGILLYIR